jgi:putative transposase
MKKAFSYRFYPTAEQESLLRQTLGCVRLVYNRALAARTEAWYKRQERIDYVQSSAMLTGWKKQADLQLQISDSRKDHLHKLTTRLIRENQTIAVESLAVKNMVKNHKLARAISDAGWGELVRQLEYKAKWYGRDLVTIDQWFPSSKRCGNCGHVLKRLPLTVREWDCPNCGTHHDRDINAAKNILAVGHTVQVCGANVRPDRHKLKGQLRKSSNGRKQKPKS